MRSLSAALLIVFLIVLGIFAIGSWSCQQPPKPFSETHENENSSPKDCSTFYGTLIVGFASGSFVRTYDKEIVALSTVVIAVFTVILGLFTISVAQSTRIAAEAAFTSANAATAIEFPIIRTNWLGPELEGTDHLVGPKEPYGSSPVHLWPTTFSVISNIEFRNYGRTPAFLEQISLGIIVAKKLTEVPKYTHTIYLGPNTAIGPRENRKIELHFGFELSADEINEISSLESVLWFYGVLTFADVMDRTHEVGFCWQWGRKYDADSIAYFYDNGSAPAAYKRKT